MARPLEKRDDIERGIIAAVGQYGLRGTTIRDIAQAAGVSEGLLYRYWKNRDDLAAAVYREQYVRLVDRLRGVAAPHPDAPSKIRALVRASLELADEDLPLLRFLLLSQHDLAKDLPIDANLREFIGRILSDGIEQGAVRRMPPELGVEFLMGIVLQPIVGMIYGTLEKPAARHADAIVAAAERTLLVDRFAVPSEPSAKGGAVARKSARPSSAKSRSEPESRMRVHR